MTPSSSPLVEEGPQAPKDLVHSPDARMEPPLTWDLDDVTTLGEAADFFGVAKTTTSNWASRYPGFPRPLAVIGGYRVYSRAQIVKWRARKFGKPEPKAPVQPREVES